MIDVVATLKKDFKQKENKYLEDFLDMKALKEKVEDKLFKQDKSLQTDTLELAEITRKKMLEKFKSPLCVEKKVKIAPPNYSKENYLATLLHKDNCPQNKYFGLKEHFEGIQTALVKEVKEMKEIFEQMDAEVEQNAMDKQCADIKRKNLLIENENPIADCLSNELLYSVMNAVNIVSRFS
ncbi:hypothetical protein Tco_0201608 [Tanacetum coccineum]